MGAIGWEDYSEKQHEFTSVQKMQLKSLWETVLTECEIPVTTSRGTDYYIDIKKFNDVMETFITRK